MIVVVLLVVVASVEEASLSSSDRQAPDDCPAYALSQHSRIVSYLRADCWFSVFD